MKSARECAEEAYSEVHVIGSDAAIDVLERLFKEHARDQRHACAEAVCAIDVTYPLLRGTARVDMEAACDHALSDAHAAVMNAPAPGEDR